MNDAIFDKKLLRIAARAIVAWLIVWCVVWLFLTAWGIALFFDNPVLRVDPMVGYLPADRMGFDIRNAMVWSWWKACIVGLVISQTAVLSYAICGTRR